MAVLEKIRQRNIFLTIIIGLALLLFILTLAGNTGQEMWRQIQNFTGGNAALKVGDKSLDVQEFGQELEQYNKLMGDQRQQQDASATRAAFIQQKTMELMLDEECEDLGIVTSKAELNKYTVGDSPLQPIVQLAQSVQMDPQTLYRTIQNPPQELAGRPEFNDLKERWDLTVDQIDKGIREQKVAMLAQNLVQPSALELKQLAEDNGVVYDVQVVRKDYSSEDDKNYKVTDADLNNAYVKYQSLFNITEPQRRVHYIVVDIEPSAKDIAAADKRIASAFKALQDTTDMLGVRGMSDLIVDEIVVTATEANDSTLKGAIAGGTGHATQTKSGYNYTMYKNLSSYVAADSLSFNVVAINGAKALRDSILTQLNAGTAVADLVKKYKDNIQDGGAQGPIRPNQLDDSTRTKILAGGSDYFVLNTQGDNAVVVKVTNRGADKTFYKIGRVQFTCDPSDATSDDLRMNLQRYVGKNKTIAAFENEEAAKKQGLNLQETVVSAGQAQLGNGYMGISDSYSAIKWAFDNKPGSVSPILDIDNGRKMVVVAVDDKYDGKYLPITDPNVKKFLTDRVIADKKGDALIKRYDKKANDIAGFAKLMEVNVDSVQVTFAGNNAGIEPGLVGRIVAAKGDKVQPLFKGDQAVYAYVVTGNHPSERKLGDEELRQMYGSQRPIDLQQAFLSSRKVKNNTMKFYQ